MKNTIGEYAREYTKDSIYCPDCGKTFTGARSYYGWGITAQGQFDAHKKVCEDKKQLLQDITICKTQSKISECLNCQRYQKECSWVNKK